MDPSLASTILSFLMTSTTTASEGLQKWAWFIFGLLFTISLIFSWGHKAIKGEGFDWSWFGGETIKAVGIAVVIAGYFALSIPWMEAMREAGMNLSGSSAETVDIGEIARQSLTINDRVEEAVSNLASASWSEIPGNIPEIIALRFLDWITQFLYIVIALTSIWLFSKFMLGYLVGGVFIGGLGHKGTFQYGMTAIGYVVFSAMPLFLLAYLQGLSAQLLDAAAIDGKPVSMPVLRDIVAGQGYLVIMSFAAAAVPREFLSSLVGMSGAPSASNAARSMAMGSNATYSSVRQVMSMFQRSGGAKNLGSPVSGGGSAPPSPVGSAPKSLPKPSNKP